MTRIVVVLVGAGILAGCSGLPQRAMAPPSGVTAAGGGGEQYLHNEPAALARASQ